MNANPLDRVLEALRAMGREPIARGDSYSCCCPAHEEKNPSFSFKLADDGRVLVHCFAGCKFDAVAAALRLDQRDLFADDGRGWSPRRSSPPPSRPQVLPVPEPDAETFPTPEAAAAKLERELGRKATRRDDYYDAAGRHVFSELRFPEGDGKVFRQIALDAAGTWQRGLPPAPRHLYRLPQLLAAEGPVYVAEGAKAASAIASLGLCATTSTNGCLSPGKSDWSPLRGRFVVIVPDRDENGEKYAVSVTGYALDAGAEEVRVVRLADHWPDLPTDGGDAHDWIEHHDAADPAELRGVLEQLAAAAVAVKARDDLEGMTWVPCGRQDGMKVRVTVSRDGRVVDLREIDLGDADERDKHAARITDSLDQPGLKVAAVKAWLLQAAAERAGAAPEDAKVSERLLTFEDCVAEWRKHEKRPTILTDFQPFDEATGGIPCGQLTVFLAEPSAGKTALMIQLVIGALLKNRDVIALWGLGEMNPAMIAERAACVGASISGSDAVTMGDAERRTETAHLSLASLEQSIGQRFHVLTDLNVDMIEAAVKRTGAKLLVIDYLQLVTGGPGQDRVSDTDAVMARIKKLATAENVAVVMASSVPRGVDGSSRIGSLGRGSAEIDYGADMVFLGDPDECRGPDDERAVLWRCKKSRNGALRDIDTVFQGGCQTFFAANRVPEIPDFKSQREAG